MVITLSIACGNGEIKVFNAFTGKMTFSMVVNQHEVMPFTCIRWRPQIAGEQKSAAVLVTTQSDGVVQHWHVNTGKCQHTIKEDNGNNLYALDFAPDGRTFAVAGSDTYVYVYDEITKQRLH